MTESSSVASWGCGWRQDWIIQEDKQTVDVMEMFLILTVVMVSWEYASLKTYQIVCAHTHSIYCALAI